MDEILVTLCRSVSASLPVVSSLGWLSDGVVFAFIAPFLVAVCLFPITLTIKLLRGVFNA